MGESTGGEIVNDPPTWIPKTLAAVFATLVLLAVAYYALNPGAPGQAPATVTATVTVPVRETVGLYTVVVERTVIETKTETVVTLLEPKVYIAEPLPENIRVRVRVFDYEVRLYVLNTGNETARLRVYAVLRNTLFGSEGLASAVVDDLEPGVERAVSLRKGPLDAVIVLVVLGE